MVRPSGCEHSGLEIESPDRGYYREHFVLPRRAGSHE